VDQPFAFSANPFVTNRPVGVGGGNGNGGAGGLANIAPAAGGNLNDIAQAAGGAGDQAQACPALTDEWVNLQLNTFAFGDLNAQQQQVEDCRLALERRATAP
jgi:hypothetical protein